MKKMLRIIIYSVIVVAALVLAATCTEQTDKKYEPLYQKPF